MRQPRRGTPLCLLLAFLFAVFVPGHPGGEAADALLWQPVVAMAASRHQPLSRQVTPGAGRHDLSSAVVRITTGSGGGHPVAALPPGLARPLPGPRLGSSPLGGHQPPPLSAPPVKPGRAPPSTGNRTENQR